MAAPQVTEWDEQGKPVTSGAAAPAGVSEWDEKGTPITTVYANPQKAAQPAVSTPQSSGVSGSWDEPQWHGGGSVVGQGIRGVLGGAGLPEHLSDVPGAFKSLYDTISTNIKPYHTPGQGVWGNPAPGSWKKPNPMPSTQMPPLSAGEGSPVASMLVGSPIKGIGQIAEGLNSKDWGQVAHGAGTAIGGLAMTKAMLSGDKLGTNKVQDLLDGQQKLARIDKAKVSMVNDMVRGPLTRLDQAIGNEVGKHADAVLKTDEIDMQLKGNKQGFVNTGDAAKVATGKTLEQMKTVSPHADDLITRGALGPMSLREAKSLTTDVGREASSLQRAGRSREAATMWTYYDKLHESTADRAKDLGATKSWQHYIDEAGSWAKMQGGLAGELQHEPIHANVIKKLTDPDRAAESQQLTSKMKQYGIDPETYESAQISGRQLMNLTKQQGNVLYSKLRTIVQHPWTAAPAVVGASLGAHALGVPGGLAGMVLPLIVAGKVGGWLDNAKIASILKEVERVTPSESSLVHPAGEGPMSVEGGQPAPPAAPPKNLLPPAGSIQLGPSSTEKPPREPIQRGPERREGYNPPEVERRTSPQDRRTATGYGSPTNLETGTMEDIRKLKQDLNSGKINQGEYNEEYRKLKLRAIDVARNPGDTKAVKMDIGKERQSAAEARTGERERKVAAIQEAEKRYGSRFKAPSGWTKGRRGWEPEGAR